MPMLERTIRTVVSIVAVTVIAVNLFGIVAVWFIERRATDVALKGFGLVEAAAAAINAGVARVDGFVTTSRTEVKQAAETITAVGREAAANSSVLIALNERLETSLAPRIGQMQQTLAPVRDAMAKIGVAIEMANSLPMLAGRTPRLAGLDEAFNQLDQLTADLTQLRGTLRAVVGSQKGQVNPDTLGALAGLTQRIDTRLAEVQTGVQGLHADIAAWQLQLASRKSRLLILFNLLALLTTLALAWFLYSQIIVMRHYRRRTAPAAGRRWQKPCAWPGWSFAGSEAQPAKLAHASRPGWPDQDR